MKKIIVGLVIATIIGAVICLVATTESFCGNKDKIVGGPCGYESQPGVCHITKVKKGSTTLFTFTGKVNGSDVQLKKNEADGPFKLNEEMPCSIQFITSGTCTPCGFDLKGTWGSCGPTAWEVFRGER